MYLLEIYSQMYTSWHTMLFKETQKCLTGETISSRQIVYVIEHNS